jgi:hypothetical protein
MGRKLHHKRYLVRYIFSTFGGSDEAGAQPDYFYLHGMVAAGVFAVGSGR